MGIRAGAPTEQNPGIPATTTPETVPRLTAVSGPGAGRALAMTHTIATVGRHPTNDLALLDARVSGVHLELRRRGARLHVRDAGSTNGTWLGANRVHEIELTHGSEIIVGDTVLRLDADPGAAPVAVSPNEAFGELVGRTTVMRELFATLERVAPKMLSVLVQGETGTGKEELARAIHAASSRASGPFVVVDATSLPETLVEALLFGHEAGSLQGSPDSRVGLFEAANGGTVFLDEIGELAPALQSRFLAVLERREITRLGGQTPKQVDLRVIASTHRDLRQEIEKGRFREDLYYRLAQVRVQLPPLRDRTEDIPLLCQKLLATIERGTPIMVEAGAMTHLAAQAWPGNVRELRNVLARAAALATNGIITRSDIGGEGAGFRGMPEERSPLYLSGDFASAKGEAVERFERAYLSALMRRCEGNVSRAAREADLARHHLRDLLKKRGLYGVAWPDGDPNEG